MVQEIKEDQKCQDDGDALESVLGYVGQMGRYQKLMFVAMMPFGFIFAFVYFVQMFISATPQKHWCAVPDLGHLEPEVRRNLTSPILENEWDRCKMYDANWSQVLETMEIPSGSPIVPCQYNWEYQLEDIPYHTVVSERGWVCQFAGYEPLTQSIFFVGSVVGGPLFGWLSDRYGRVPALVGANLVGFVGGIATIFTTGVLDFAICRFLVGMSYDSSFMLIYILVLEYVGPRQRTWVGNMSIALYFGGGCIVLPWLAFWLSNWRLLLVITSCPMLCALAVPFVLPESVRWLSSKGRVNEAVAVLKKFERVNNTKIPQEAMDEFIMSSGQARQSEESISSLFNSSSLRTMMALLISVYMACALVFDGLVRMSESVGSNFFIIFTLTSATEIPSVTLLTLVLDRWGRRVLTCVPMVIAGILSLLAAFLNQSQGVWQVSLVIIARFFINMSYNACIQWATELLPTAVRASGSSVVHVSGYVAVILSPFVVYMERVWQPLPLLTVGLVSLLAGGASLLLPETRGRALPHSLADGERLMRLHSLCRKPEDIEAKEWKNGTQKALIT